jgi:hypothetical protein
VLPVCSPQIRPCRPRMSVGRVQPAGFWPTGQSLRRLNGLEDQGEFSECVQTRDGVGPWSRAKTHVNHRNGVLAAHSQYSSHVVRAAARAIASGCSYVWLVTPPRTRLSRYRCVCRDDPRMRRYAARTKPLDGAAAGRLRRCCRSTPLRTRSGSVAWHPSGLTGSSPARNRSLWCEIPPHRRAPALPRLGALGHFPLLGRSQRRPGSEWVTIS